MKHAEQGLFAGGLGRNRKYLTGLAERGELPLRIAPAVPQALVDLLFDSETSGGLLFSVPPASAEVVSSRFASKGETVWEIGEVVPEVAIEIA
jgi:selenide,water dikinase